MLLFEILIKGLIVMFILRTVLTRQELHFNPIGKLIAAATEPLFTGALKVTKKTSDRLTPVIIILLAVIYSLIIWVFSRHGSIVVALSQGFVDTISFLFIFYIISILVGSFNNTGVGYYTAFFYRVGLFWVKLARSVAPMEGNLILIPTVVILSVVYMLLMAGISAGFTLLSGAALTVEGVFGSALILLLGSLAQLLNIMIVVVVVRALISWVSPDPRNPIVQLIVTLSDPITEPFRKVIPPLGFIDISPVVAILVLSLVRGVLLKFTGLGV